MATDEQAARLKRLRGIYAILNDGEETLALARASIDAGIAVVQYRAKRGVHDRRLRELRAMTRERGALLIVNDDWRAALAFGCDGVHLGPDDDGFLDIAPIRAEFAGGLIGLSCGTPEEAGEANRLGADYIGVGAVYATSSKADAGAPIGIEGLRRVASAATMPVAAIGGIDAGTIRAVREAGVAMAAVISAISAANDPARAARELVAMWSGDGEV